MYPMGTKTISVTEAAYESLAERKRPGESFTDVILRLTRRRSLAELADVVSDDEAEALAEAVEANREERIRRRRARLGEGDEP